MSSETPSPPLLSESARAAVDTVVAQHLDTGDARVVDDLYAAHGQEGLAYALARACAFRTDSRTCLVDTLLRHKECDPTVHSLWSLTVAIAANNPRATLSVMSDSRVSVATDWMDVARAVRTVLWASSSAGTMEGDSDDGATQQQQQLETTAAAKVFVACVDSSVGPELAFALLLAVSRAAMATRNHAFLEFLTDGGYLRYTLEDVDAAFRARDKQLYVDLVLRAARVSFDAALFRALLDDGDLDYITPYVVRVQKREPSALCQHMRASDTALVPLATRLGPELAHELRLRVRALAARQGDEEFALASKQDAAVVDDLYQVLNQVATEKEEEAGQRAAAMARVLAALPKDGTGVSAALVLAICAAQTTEEADAMLLSLNIEDEGMRCALAGIIGVDADTPVAHHLVIYAAAHGIGVQ